MKYWVILLLLMPVVLAGQIQHIDLVNNDYAFVTLNERDIVDFEYNNSIHRIMIRELVPEKNSAKITFFMEGIENPLYVTISDKIKLQIDYEKDGFNDMNVWYAGINEEGNITLKLERIHEEKQTTNKEENFLDSLKSFIAFGDISFFKNDKILYGSIISVLVIVILLSNKRLVRRKFRRMKRRLRRY